MNHRLLKLSIAVCAAFSVALGLGGCKENTVISSNVTPAVDNINTFQITLPDSLFEAKTVRDDSVITSSATAIYQALGRVNDDLGNTTASIYLQFVPKSTGAKIPTTEIKDSVVVILPYSGFSWGDTSTVSSYTVKAYQIEDTLKLASSYYAFSKKATRTAPIGTGTYRVGPKGTGAGVIADSVQLASNGSTIRVAPHLRVKLDLSIADTIQKALDTNTTFDGFIRAFNGIYLVPDTSMAGRALAYFRIDGTINNYTGANLLIYTHNAAGRDTSYSLPYNTTYASRFNRITRVYQQESQLFSPTNPVLTMQNQPGASIDFRFVNLDKQTLIPANAVINKAEIIFTKINTPLDEAFFKPARIYPMGISSLGNRYVLLDRYPTSTIDGLNFIDGTPRDSAGVIRYTLNIPRELQSSITTKESELHLLIGGTTNYPGAYRLLLGSKYQTNPAYRPVVRIIYSKQK